MNGRRWLIWAFLLPSLLPGLMSAFNAKADEFGFEMVEPEPPAKPAWTQRIDLGVRIVPTDNFAFGQYNGLDSEGLQMDGGFVLGGGVWSLHGSRLGTDNRELSFDFRALPLRVTMDYDESAYRGNDSGRTPFTHTGQGRLSLPANWQGGLDSDEFPTGLMNGDVRNGIDHQAFRASAQWDMTARLTGKVSLEKEAVEGTQIKGLAIYSDAANPQAVVLPVPVDEQSTVVAAELGYTGDRSTAVLGYSITDFDNHHARISWDNPFANGLGPAVDFPNGAGAFAGAPDYQYRQASLASGLRLGDSVRLVLDGFIGESEREGHFVDYTVNPALVVSAPLPATALNAPLSTSRLHGGIYWRPARRVRVNLHYRYEDREDENARHLWQYVRGDGADQPDAAFAVHSRPLQRESDLYEVEGIVTLANRARLSVSWEYEKDYRRYSAVTRQETDRVSVGFQFPPALLPGRHQVTFSGADAAGSTYEWSNSFFQLMSVQMINRIPDAQRWTNHPLLRQYHVANRQEFGGLWRSEFDLGQHAAVQLRVETRKQDYDGSTLGLTASRERAGNLAVNYFAGDVVLSAYLDYRWVERAQRGRAFRGGIEKPANVIDGPLPEGSDPARDYTTQQDNEMVAAGASLDWTVNGRWSVSGQLGRLIIDDDYEVTTGGARDLGAGAPLPTIDWTTNEATLAAVYTYSDQLSLTWKYQFFDYRNDDWRLAGIEAGSISNLLALGQHNPDENVSVFEMAMTYEF
jgi:MtrB/PioB family decaheme-associated outer membrane protein